MEHPSKEQDDDVLMALPEEILVSVLSCLKLKEAVRTSILSRRWKDLWRRGRLNFDPLNLPWGKDYIDWMKKVIYSRQTIDGDVLTDRDWLRLMRNHDYVLKERWSDLSLLPQDMPSSVLNSLERLEDYRIGNLSKEWKDSWNRGRFKYDPSNLRWGKDYIEWVDRVLDSHDQVVEFEELRVCFDLDKRFTKKINRWVVVALTKRVRRLELDLTPINFSYRMMKSKNYSLPLKLLMSVGSSKSLTCLCLKYVQVKGQILEHLLSNCVSLETLHVLNSESQLRNNSSCSQQLIDLKVCGSSSLRLKHLHISFCHNIKSMEVSAPNLVSFSYYGRHEIKLQLKYVPQLRDVNYGAYKGFRHSDFLYSTLASYASQLVNLSLNFISSIDQTMLQCPPLPNLRYLTCDVLVVERSSSMGLLRLTPLIHAAPYLHKFKLNIEVTKDAPIELEEREIGEVLEFVARKIDYNYFPNEKLREVEIVGFLGSKPEIELLTYLLKTALEVNKIVINTLPPRVSLGTPALRKERKAPERWKAIQFVRKLGRQQLGLESDEARAVD